MRIYYIIGLLVLTAAMGILVSTFSSASTYVGFTEAAATERSVHIIGSLVKDARGEVVGIEQSHPQAFSFLLQDNEGVTSRVTYAFPMPSDFIRADKVVIVGRHAGAHFVAEKILLKCPSKYETKYEANTLS